MAQAALYTSIILIPELVRIFASLVFPLIPYYSSALGTDITPVSGGDLYFGFGGLAIDPQKNGTVMVAALNSWWPDGQIFRSTDGGASWTALWAWNGYPNLNKYYTYDDQLAPWIGPGYVDTTAGNLQIGWMMECASTAFASSAISDLP